MNLKKLKDLELEDLIEFRDHGSMSKAPEEIVQYVEMLDKVRRMHVRFDKYGSRDAIINHLMKFDGLSHYLAAKMHDDSIEYFNADRAISKNAWRNKLAEMYEKVVNTGFVMARDANELMKVAKGIKDIAEILNLDEPDREEFPAELLGRPIKLYTSNAEDLGMAPIDRYQLGRFIDDLPEITESEKETIKRDAQLLPVKFFKE